MRVESGGEVELQVSMILKWYRSDFGNTDAEVAAKVVDWLRGGRGGGGGTGKAIALGTVRTHALSTIHRLICMPCHCKANPVFILLCTDYRSR